MKLEEGIAALGIALPDATVSKLSAYLSLLAKWNKTYNLTAVRKQEEMVTHHLLDCLAVLPIVRNSALAGRHFRLVDVGSGAGLPGLVLALACPEWSVTSIEAVEKKAAFQRQVKIELGMANVEVHGGRVEECVGQRFSATISRAFASLADFIGAAGHLSDCLWAMKGVYPADEVAALPAGWRIDAVHPLCVPGLAAERCLLQVGRV